MLVPIKESNRDWRREKGIRSNVLSAIGNPISDAVLLAAVGILLYVLFAIRPFNSSRSTSPLAVSQRAGSGCISRAYPSTQASLWCAIVFSARPRSLRSRAQPSSATSFFCGFGVLTGLFGASVLEKLRDVADDVFRTAPGTGDAARRDALSRPEPAIFESSPAELHATAETPWITLRGAAFVPGATVLIGGKARRTAYLDHIEPRVLLELGDASTAGTIQVCVELPPPERIRSNTIAIPIVAQSDLSVCRNG